MSPFTDDIPPMPPQVAATALDLLVAKLGMDEVKGNLESWKLRCLELTKDPRARQQ